MSAPSLHVIIKNMKCYWFKLRQAINGKYTLGF